MDIQAKRKATMERPGLFRPFMPHPLPYEKGEGLNFAMLLADKAQKLSLFLTITGWLFVVAGALLAIAGSVLGSNGGDTRDFGDIFSSHLGLVCSAFAIASAGVGWTLLDRGSAATRTASIATNAINTASSDSDRRAYEACVNAKAAWLEGRMNIDRLESIVASLNQTGIAPSKAAIATTKKNEDRAETSSTEANASE